MPNSRFALHSLASLKFTVCALFLPRIHGLYAFFRPLLSAVSTAPSWPASQFTVCTSRFTRLRSWFHRNTGMCSILSSGVQQCHLVVSVALVVSKVFVNHALYKLTFQHSERCSMQFGRIAHPNFFRDAN